MNDKQLLLDFKPEDDSYMGVVGKFEVLKFTADGRVLNHFGRLLGNIHLRHNLWHFVSEIPGFAVNAEPDCDCWAERLEMRILERYFVVSGWPWFALAATRQMAQGPLPEGLDEHRFYRSPCGQRKCVVGTLIPDSLYTTELEGALIVGHGLGDVAREMGWEWNARRILRRAQVIHDNNHGVPTMAQYLEAFNDVTYDRDH